MLTGVNLKEDFDTVNVYFAHVDRVNMSYSCLPAFKLQFRSQRSGMSHQEVDDPARADVILFTECHQLPDEWNLESIANSREYSLYPHKVAVYDERDTPWCRFPGIYVSMPARNFVEEWQIAGSYYHVEENEERLPKNRGQRKPDLLFSFIGSRSHRCREEIFRLQSPDSLVERTDGFVFYDPESANFQERRRTFSEIVERSKFVLCPRGQGVASIRLFEVMSAGRVPVIISDEWQEPPGPKWEEFSFRWAESNIGALPGFLESQESRAAQMGMLARQAYDSWFASEVVMSRAFDQLEDMMLRQHDNRFPSRGVRNGQYLRCLGNWQIGRARGLLRSVARR